MGLNRQYDIVLDVESGVTEQTIKLIQASTGVKQLKISGKRTGGTSSGSLCLFETTIE